eukprot:7862979-Pyramimonas_sp.AAC.1
MPNGSPEQGSRAAAGAEEQNSRRQHGGPETLCSALCSLCSMALCSMALWPHGSWPIAYSL